MAVFPSFKLTKKGEELLNRCIGEGKVLTFTKIKIGDGVPVQDWRELTDIQSSFKEFPVLETSVQKDQVLRIKAHFDNKGFLEDKKFKEIGVFVKLEGLEGELLYSYTNAGDTGDIIPSESRGFFSRTLDIANYIGYATNITFNIEQTRNNYDFNTEAEVKVATFLKTGDRIRLWGRLVQGDIQVRHGIVTSSSTSLTIDNGLFVQLTGEIVVNTIEDLKNLKGAIEGTIVEVLGYYEKGDGAGHKRIIAGADDGSGIQLTNNLWANIVHGGEVNVSWFGAKGDGVSDDTVAVKKAIDSISGNLGQTIVIPKGDFLVRNLIINKAGVVFKGYGNKISRLVGDTDLSMTVQPLLNGNPFTNIGFGGIFFDNCQLYAISDVARNSGIGLRLINCFVTNFTNLYVAGFKKNIELCGCHYNSLFNFYAVDEVNSPTNPNEEIFNRGYAISVSRETFTGEHVSSALKIEGGWLHNTSLDLENSANVVIRNIDIEPSSQPVLVGNGSLWEGNRFERMDYYAVAAFPPKYDRFNWFIIKGDDNTFRNNSIHSLGANNEPFKNSKFLVEGNNNKFYFNENSIRYGLIDFKNNTFGNYCEVGKFEDMKYFGIDTGSNYAVENIQGIYEGENEYKLIEDKGYVHSCCADYFVKGCASLNIFKNEAVQGLNKVKNTYTVVPNSPNKRTIFGLNTSDKYSKGKYAFKFKLTSNADFKIRFTPSLVFNSLVSISCVNKNKKVIFVRFEIKDDNTHDINPTLTFVTNTGVSATIEDIELLKFDGSEYVRNIQFNSSNVATIEELNNPYLSEKMKQEGIYADFINYMDEKTAYDNQQRKKEKAMQLAYEEALKENPSLTYEEFVSARPTTFSRRKRSLEIQEPVPSQALLEFKERYLG